MRETKVGRVFECQPAWKGPDESEGRAERLRGCLVVAPSVTLPIPVLEEFVVATSLEVRVVRDLGTFHRLHFLLARWLWEPLLPPASLTVRRNVAVRRI